MASRTRKADTVLLPSRRVPVRAEGDVVVVGGGTAGFVAAVAAARAGARTVLIEREGFLGGAMTGTYATNPGWFRDSDGNHIIGGLGWECIERMERAGAALVDRAGWTVQTFPPAARLVAMDMVGEAGVDLLLHCWAGEVVADNGAIRGVVVQSKSGREVVRGGVFVDATADADIAHAAGAPTEMLAPDELWQTSVDLTICNVDGEKVQSWAEANRDLLEWAYFGREGGEMDRPAGMLSFLIRGAQTARLDDRGGLRHVGPVPTVKLMIHRGVSRVQGSVEIDATDVRGLTLAQTEARRRAMEHLAYLKRTVPGYDGAVVVGESSLGVRETRRIVGEYRLTADDLRGNARFDDVVALNARPLDRHLKGGVFEIINLDGNHDVPLRALTPKAVTNLLVAGRCISSDHESNASLRGVATCLATGHAAGAAAALAAKSAGRVRDINVGELQPLLRHQGAILGI
jgi:hypothetical protein